MYSFIIYEFLHDTYHEEGATLNENRKPTKSLEATASIKHLDQEPTSVFDCYTSKDNITTKHQLDSDGIKYSFPLDVSEGYVNI